MTSQSSGTFNLPRHFNFERLANQKKLSPVQQQQKQREEEQQERQQEEALSEKKNEISIKPTTIEPAKTKEPSVVTTNTKPAVEFPRFLRRNVGETTVKSVTTKHVVPVEKEFVTSNVPRKPSQKPSALLQEKKRHDSDVFKNSSDDEEVNPPAAAATPASTRRKPYESSESDEEQPQFRNRHSPVQKNTSYDDDKLSRKPTLLVTKKSYDSASDDEKSVQPRFPRPTHNNNNNNSVGKGKGGFSSDDDDDDRNNSPQQRSRLTLPQNKQMLKVPSPTPVPPINKPQLQPPRANSVSSHNSSSVSGGTSSSDAKIKIKSNNKSIAPDPLKAAQQKLHEANKAEAAASSKKTSTTNVKKDYHDDSDEDHSDRSKRFRDAYDIQLDGVRSAPMLEEEYRLKQIDLIMSLEQMKLDGLPMADDIELSPKSSLKKLQFAYDYTMRFMMRRQAYEQFQQGLTLSTNIIEMGNELVKQRTGYGAELNGWGSSVMMNMHRFNRPLQRLAAKYGSPTGEQSPEVELAIALGYSAFSFHFAKKMSVDPETAMQFMEYMQSTAQGVGAGVGAGNAAASGGQTNQSSIQQLNAAAATKPPHQQSDEQNGFTMKNPMYGARPPIPQNTRSTPVPKTTKSAIVTEVSETTEEIVV